MLRFFSVFILSLLCISLIGNAVQAQDQRFRLLRGDMLKRVVDNNTYWKRYNLDRVYFNADGGFIQQLNSGWNGTQPGLILTGQWTTSDREVCWSYDTETQNKIKVGTAPYCYEIFSNAPDSTFMTLHNEEFKLYQVINGQRQENSPAFVWDRWAYDNYILDPEYVPTIIKELGAMRAYRDTRTLSSGTINREDLNKTMKAYYDMVIDKIFFVGSSHQYFTANGGYFSINTASVDNDSPIEDIATNDRFGKWIIKGNWHCGKRGSKKPTCEYILPKGKGLIRSYDGILGFHHNGFSRVHGEMAVGHMDPEDSSYPELYEFVDQKLK